MDAKIFLDRGAQFLQRGNFPAAIEAFGASLKEYERLVAQGRDELWPELAKTRLNLGSCLSENGDFSAAEDNYQTSLALLQALQAAEQLFLDAIELMRAIANWHRHPQRPTGADKPRAFKLAKLGLDWLDTLLNSSSKDEDKGSLLRKNIPLFHLATDLALELNQPDQAYLIFERSKSRVLVEQMLRERAEPSPQIDENLRRQYQQLRERLRQIVNQLTNNTVKASERNPEQDIKLLEDQKAVEQKLAKIRAAIAEQDPAYGDAIQPRPLKIEQIATLIPANTLAIAFEQRPDYLHLYAITTQGVHKPLRVELNMQQLTECILIFQEDITICPTEVNHVSEWLTKRLAPALSQLLPLAEKCQEILFLPHQYWHLLPLHLIQIEDQALALRYPVRYMPSLQVLSLIHEREQANTGRGCIVANPDDSLPDAEEECKTIKNHYRPKDILLEGADAKLNTVRKHLNNAQHAHISCRGFFQPDLKTCLVLADGYLQTKEIFTSLRLDNARLVVLSAAETAVIQPTFDDEYMGLASSFLFAGAHNVLATLWAVESASTRLLMEDFYQGLADGLSPTLALQRAQRQLREMGRKTVQKRLQLKRALNVIKPYKDPYYWAGFVLIGDGI